jgi:membrane protein DedA with SNARE-associated domain
LDQLGALLSSPWVYAVVALSVMLDVFLPVLPSGALLIAASAAGSATGQTFAVAETLMLLLCAASASCLGDLAAYRLARGGGRWIDSHMKRNRRLSAAQDLLGEVVSRGGGPLVVLARFAPAGRSVVSVAAGATQRTLAEFLPWSALAGVVWAAYSVGLGYVGGQWFDASWLSTALSCGALVVAGAVTVRLLVHNRRRAEPVTADV